MDTDYDLLINIAHMYYELHMTQQEISDELYISRSQISRLLKKAYDDGIVEVYIHYPYERHRSLEKQLSSLLNVKEVLLADSNEKVGKEIVTVVCSLAADYLPRLFTSQSVIGITWGSTVYNTIKQIRPSRNLINMTAVQLTGCRSYRQNTISDGPNIVRMFSERYGCKMQQIVLPLSVENQAVRDSLISLPSIADTFEMTNKVDVIFSSVGVMDNWTDYFPPEDMAYLQENKAIGSMSGYFFDINGNILDAPFYNRFIMADCDVFRKAAHSVAIITDRHKASALLGACRAGLINTLITDTKTAYRLLSIMKIKPTTPNT